MTQYRVNKNQQSNGDREVHKEGCVYYSDLTNFAALGEHSTCQSAVSAAQLIVGNSADGCAVCIPTCHNPTRTTESSCNSREPLIKLDDRGRASILNYSLPQSTSYSGTAFLSLDIPDSYYLESETESIWEGLQSKTLAELIDLVSLDINTQGSIGIFENIELLNGQDVVIHDSDSIILVPNENLGNEPEHRTSRIISSTIDQSAETESNYNRYGLRLIIAILPIEYIANMILQGLRPVLYTGSLGKIIRVKYVKVEDEIGASPELMIALELKMSSYLGDYGAGKTLKTFSLLPGEQTNISIRTYQHQTETRILAENVLDSYSESSAKDLQNSIQNEVNHSTNYSQNETETKTKNWKAGGSFGLNLGIFKIGGGGGADHTKVTSTSINSALQTQVGMLVNSTSHHVAKSDSLRQIDVNSEVSSTSINESEETIYRVLENINRSRVLNFVFRQLLQEFISITYIDNVSFIFYGGLNSEKSCRLASLDDLVNSVIKPDKVEEVKSMIYIQLCNVKDHNGDTQSLIEKITETYTDCISGGTKKKKIPAANTVEYVRMKKGLSQSYHGREVGGVILDTTHRILRTPSLIIDSLLGQGEALDCYNQRLQNAATKSAELENEKLEHSMKIISSLKDPMKRAEMYKKVFGECCDVPQCECDKSHL